MAVDADCTVCHAAVTSLPVRSSDTTTLFTCGKLAVEARSVRGYVAAVCFTRLAAEAAVNPA